MSDDKSNLEERVKGFNSELIPLLGKYKIGLGAQAVILPDGRLAAKPHLFDDEQFEKKRSNPLPTDAEVETKEPGIVAA